MCSVSGAIAENITQKNYPAILDIAPRIVHMQDKRS